jgi:hypothetical protein
MNNTFDNEILKLEQEIIALKTCPIKTATQMATKAVQQALSFNLEMTPFIQNYCWGENAIILTLTSTDGNAMLTSCTLENSGDASGHNLSGRSVNIRQKECGVTSVYRIYVTSVNNSDYETLDSGGSVTVNYTVLLTGTSDFTVSVTTEPYSPF